MSINWNDYPNFSADEFTCKCDTCGGNPMDKEFLDKLQAIRTKVGFPLNITSGYRCPDYNDAISSSGRKGPHTTGKACDIQVSGGSTLFLLRASLAVGVTGVGLKQKGPHSSRFVHLDVLEASPSRPRPWCWTY